MNKGRFHSSKQSGPFVNERIKARSVRVISEKGDMLGVFDTPEAIKLAFDQGLDLVEVSPNASPPVCKIIDYGKYKYQIKKKQAEEKKKQKTFEVKEVKLRPGIEDHDYGVKLKSIQRFLSEGDKVKVTMPFRGREMAHQDLGLKVLHRVRDDLEELTKIEQFPKMEGRQMVMVLAPK